MILLILLLSLSVTHTLAQFSLWPTVNSSILTQSLGVSDTCLVALNETVSCDPTLFKRTKSVDYYFWSNSNVTDLCTSTCQASAASWNQLVVSNCADETVTYNNMAVPADSISGRHVDGLNLACLTSSTGSSCLVDSQSWQGTDMIYESDGSLADEQPLTQMYDNATLCDECFTDIMKARLNSPYAASSSFNAYLGVELVNILDWCGKDSNVSLSEPTSYISASITATSTSSTAVPTCTGQSLSPTKLKQRQLLSGASAYANITQQCEDLSTEYNVPTGALLIATGNSDCNITTSTCLPPACELKQLGEADATCTSLAAQLDVAGGNVSTIQLLTWNPTIIGTCDDLQLGQYVCITPPGGAWVPAIANITNGTVGDTGGITQSYSSGTVATATPTNGITTPTPIQTGMITSCDAFHLVQSSDTCGGLATEYNLALSQFYAWNPSVGSSCLDLELGTYVCVNILGSTASSSTVTTTHNTITTPSPTQTSMVTDCDKFYDVKSGDGCAAIASTESIPLASFYAWNPAVGTTCGDLFLSYYVCVGVATVSATTTSSTTPSTTSSSTGASVTPPAPTQAGIPSDCDAYAVTEAGDGCQDFATRNGITLANLYLWNPVLDNACDNFWSGEAYCIGVS